MGIRAPRGELRHPVRRLGREHRFAATAARNRVWHPDETIKAVAYDTPIVGWRGRHVNPLRLWSARAVDPLHLDVFNEGDHLGAFSPQARAEAISKILYPSDDTASGRELRLRQEYFFVSASLQDLVRRHTRTFGSVYSLPERAAIQLNDTHPSVAIAELMRILVDLHNVPWDERLEDHRRNILLHQPYPAAGGIGELAGAVVRTASAAPSRDHLRDQCASPRDGEAGGSLDPDRLSADFADRRERRAAGQNGASRLCRLAPGQRRFGAAYRADADQRVPRLSPALSGPHRQQDQWDLVSPLAASGQSAADQAVVRGVRAARPRRSRRPGPSRRPGRRRGAAGAPRRGQARQQVGAGPDRPRAPRAAHRSRARCSMCRSSGFTNTSASC